MTDDATAEQSVAICPQSGNWMVWNHPAHDDGRTCEKSQLGTSCLARLDLARLVCAWKLCCLIDAVDRPDLSTVVEALAKKTQPYHLRTQ